MNRDGSPFFFPIVLAAVPLMAGASLFVLAWTLRAPWLMLAAVCLIAWALISFLLCLFLSLWLEKWPVAALLSFAWLCWYGAGILHYKEGGANVLMLVTFLPACLLLGLGLWLVAGYLLPSPARGRRREALQCLFTFTIGMNYPYYIIADERDEDDRLVKRVSGNRFIRSMHLPGGITVPPVGPGLVLSSCDHAVVVTDGLKFKGAQGPGVVFTEWGDRPVQPIDLRPQLRAFTVQALTKDGIAVKVLVFVPFQIEAGGEKPVLGRPFPYRKSAVFKAFHAQKMDHLPEEIKQRKWHELPEMVTKRAMQGIIAGYTFDELCAPYDLFEPGEDPRSRIVAELKEQLKKELTPLGIHVIGGGISNLLPADEAVLQQRITSWQADWARKTMLRQAEGQAERLRLVQQARAEAQTSMILTLGKRMEQHGMAGAIVPAEVIAGWFLEILQQTVQQPSVRRVLPRETTETMERVRGAVEGVRD